MPGLFFSVIFLGPFLVGLVLNSLISLVDKIFQDLRVLVLDSFRGGELKKI